ncbi:microsomal glutathione S-transferase 1-like [Xyrichtys novacula]|uniref:Microsomal glutathione S-transferase 1 n=1 Tax=Xyrichtys novacula TaxID=13765 RepID=A0AAV1F3W9_XYRNO|nr:microsomal glutathione S-transferase 1-like [Xyrichtys novacula]
MMGLMEDEVFRAFTTYASVVAVKMVLMSPLTAYFRFTRGAFANAEDVALKPPEERKKLLRTDPDVERVRRCHQNDLENVVPFLALGLLYSLSGPELSCALLHFRLFVGSRIFHTVSYVCTLPQPCRALSFIVGLLTNLSMAYRLLSNVMVL